MAFAIEEISCPRCGVKVKKGVLRCRDCGAFLDQNAEDAAARKQAWPGLPEDAAQRAADAAALAAKAPRPERSEEDLLHDMSFADTLFRQTEERIQNVSARSKDEDFLLDVTPVSDEKHVRTLKRPTSAPESSSQPASDVQVVSAAKPDATAGIKSPPKKPQVQPSVEPQLEKPKSPKPEQLAPAVEISTQGAAPQPVAEYPVSQSLYPPQQPPAPYPLDPYAGYSAADYPGAAAGYPQGTVPGYPPAAYPGGEYPQNPADYSAYQQYGYGDYNAAAYPPGTYPQQYDPNYAAQYGYSVDASGQYVYDPAQQQYDPNQQYDPAQQYSMDPLPLPTDGAEATAEPLPALDMEAAPESIPLAETPESSPEVAAPAEEPAPAVAAPAPAAEAPVKSHSEETAGDVLLAAALEEESARGGSVGEKKNKSTTGKSAVGLMVYCPYGHRVTVQMKFRGKAGRCPLCKATFFVPAELEGAEPEAAPATPAAPVSQDNRIWLEDVHLHRFSPAKVKFTPGSLAEEYDTIDLGINADGILVTTVFKAGGMFRSMQEPKKKPLTRKAVREHLAAGKPLDQAPAPHQFLLKGDILTQLKMLQPAKPGEESLFSGVPVFGEGRIAIRIPPPTSEAADQRWCLSFGLSQFREFCKKLVSLHGLADFSNTCGVPLEDQFTDVNCSFSNVPLRFLEHAQYYQADPVFKLEVVGRKCQGCGAVVAESARVEHKIGGKADTSVAKSKCPKCQQKFGDIKLYGLKPPEPTAVPSDSAAESAPVTAEMATMNSTSADALAAAESDDETFPDFPENPEQSLPPVV